VWARWSPRLLGALLVAQGTGKLLDVAGYVRALGLLIPVSGAALRVLATLWMTAELLAGAALLRPSGAAPSLTGAAGAFAVSVGYAFATVGAYLRGARVENCTCFGTYLKQRLSPWVLVQDASMLLWTFTVLRSALGTRGGARRARLMQG
jgi:hypothetical protein